LWVNINGFLQNKCLLVILYKKINKNKVIGDESISLDEQDARGEYLLFKKKNISFSKTILS